MLKEPNVLNVTCALITWLAIAKFCRKNLKSKDIIIGILANTMRLIFHQKLTSGKRNAPTHPRECKSARDQNWEHRRRLADQTCCRWWGKDDWDICKQKYNASTFQKMSSWSFPLKQRIRKRGWFKNSTLSEQFLVCQRSPNSLQLYRTKDLPGRVGLSPMHFVNPASSIF